MTDKDKPAVATPTTPVTATGSTPTATVPPPPKRSPGHRGADVKDTVAEMAARAQEISMEAGSKMAAAMKDVIGAAAGLTGFVLESARDLLQYMVRRGQMTQEEADKLMREVEASHAKRKPTSPPAPSALRPPPRVEPTHTPHTVVSQAATSHSAPSHTAASHSTSHTATSHSAPSHAASTHHHAPTAAKHPAKHAGPAKGAAKKPTMKAAAKKHPVKAAKAKPKASGKAKRR